MKMIIKDTNGEIREVEVTADINIDVQPGQQLFFTGATSSDVSISGNNTDVRLTLVDENGETVSIGMPGLAEQISLNDPMDPFSLTTALGVSTTREGDDEIEKIVSDPELEVGEMIDQLKVALAQSHSADKDGVLIDDFGSLVDISDSSAANTDQLSSEQFPTVSNTVQDIKLTKARASRPEDEDTDEEEDTEENEEDDVDVVTDTVYGDDLNADGIIGESKIDILDESGDEIINQTESLNTTITGNIGEGGVTLDSVVLVDENGNQLNVDLSNVIIEADGSYIINDVDLSSLSDGTLTITSNSTDLDGLKATDSDTISKDTVFGDKENGSDEGITADIVDGSDTGTSQTDNLTNDTTPTITGTTDANANIVITNTNGDVVGTATADANGNYSITTTELSEGTQDLTITATDTTGNVTSTTQSIEVDRSTTNSVNITDESGDNTVNASEITNSDIAGNVEAGSTINSLTITDGVNIVTVNQADITLNTDGSYTVDNIDLSTLNDGTLTTSITSTDLAGNQISSEGIINKDTTVDSLTIEDLVSNEGADTASLIGNTEPGAKVTLTLTDSEGTEVTQVVIADENGDYTATFGTEGLSDGDYTVSGVSTDTAGNSESAVITGDDLNTFQDSFTIEDLVSNEGADTASLIGNTEPGAKVTLTLTDSEGTEVTQVVIADENGDYTATFGTEGLSDGDYTVSGVSTDTAGNSESAVITGDDLNTFQDSFTIEDLVSNEGADTASLIGNTEPGAKVTLTLTDSNGTEVTVEVNADGNGDYSVTFGTEGLSDGDYTVSGVSTDTAGNSESTSIDGSDLNTFQDSLTIDALVSNEGEDTASLTGNTEPNASVELTLKDSNGTEVTVEVNADGNGDYSATFATDGLSDGDYTVSGTATDTAGNSESTSIDGSDLNTFQDSLTIDALVSNEGEDTASLTGNTEPNASVELTLKDSNGTEVTVEVNADGNGDYSATFATDGLSDGDYTVSGTATDTAGNSESTSIDGSDLNTFQDSLTIDALVSNEGEDTASLTGNTEPNASVELTLKDSNGTEVTVEVNADGNGDYSATFATDGLSDGDYTVSGTATDTAGNSESTSIDGSDLNTFQDSLTIDALVSNEGEDTASLTGNTEPNASVELTLKDSNGTEVTVEVNADGNGDYSATFATDGLSDGDYTVSGTATDTAGNSESTSIDGSDLNTFQDSISSDIIDSSDTGVSITDDLTKDSTPTITGNTEPNAQVTITNESGVSIGTGNADANGDYSITTSELSDGAQKLIITATDSAGNETSIEQNIIVDTNADVDENFTVTVATDDEITNDLESGHVSSTLTGVDADAVSVSVVFTDEENSVTVEATQNEDGSWSVADADLTTLNDGNITVNATVTDDSGNTKVVSDSLDLDTNADVDENFTVTVATDDEITNDLESGHVSSTLAGVDADAVSVSVVFTDEENSVTVEATQNEDGSWSVADADLTTLNDGNITVNATVTDDAGNTKVVSDSLDLDTNADVDENFTVTVATDDEITNDLESGHVSSTLAGVDADAVSVSVVFTDEENSVTVEATQNEDGSWSVADADLTTLNDGNITVNATVTDDAGNTKEVSDSLDLDTTINTESDSNIIVEDTLSSATGNVLSNDDNDITITAEIFNGSYGSVEIASDGSYTYTLNNGAQSLEENEEVSDIFTYTATDEAGNTTTETLTINITGTNDAPIVNTVDLGSFDEDHSLIITPEQLLANSTDMDGDDLSISSVSVDPSIGTITQDGDNFIFTPNENFNGDNISLSFSVTDGIETVNSTATVDVIAINDGPILEGSSDVSFVEGDKGVIVNDNITITDIDDDNIDGATITIGTNYVSTEDSLSFTNQNGISGSFNAQTGELTLTGSATKQQYEEALESVTYTNNSNNPDLEVRDITFTVTDGEGTSATINSSVNISAVNDAPVISVDNYEVDKDEGSLAITLSASDVDSDIDSFTLTTLPDNGTLYLDSELTQEISVNTPISSDGTTQVFFQPDYGNDENTNSFGEEWFDSNSINFDFFATDNGSQGLDPVNSQSATINIVVDDVPFVYGETTQIIDENDIGSDANFASGNVLSNDYLGDDSSGASIHEVTFTAGGETGTAVVGETTSTEYGDLTIEADGTWNFTPDSDLDQTAGDLNFSFSYNVIDGDGDISETTATQTITIQDGNELTIGTPDSSQVVDESNLVDGSDTNTNALSVSGSLAISTGSDSIDVKFDETMDTDANSDQNSVVDLTHEGTPITYEYSEDGHTLTGVAGDTDIFTVELTKASTSSDDAGYTFTLLDSIDHHDGNLTLDELNIPFNIIATDTEGDSVSGSFSIKVLDDEPIETNGYVINEDGDVSFNISADRVSSVTFDGIENGTATYEETTGQITYTPDEDFSGFEDFTYTTTDADGDSVTATITVDVKPIVESDTEAINNVASGDEDTWIELDIETPSVNDADSETITEVRLENLPNGSELQYSDGTSITINNGTAVVDLDRVSELQVKAPSDSGDDFDIATKIVVTDTATLSDDSDISNTKTFTGKIEVNVDAVADDTSITSQDASATEQGLESNKFSLSELISDVSFGDTKDGSESHTITIENLPEGTVIANGRATLSENPDGTVNITVDSSKLNRVKLQFTDTDEGDYEVSMYSTATESEGDIAVSDTVTATLHVNPSAGEVEFDTQTVSGDEDSAIALNIDVTNENPDSDGSESVTGIEISGIPAGATILDSEGNVLFESTEDGSSVLLPMDASDIEGLQVQAAENDSTSFNLEVKIESNDGSVVGLSESKEITVNVDADVDNSITADNITGLEDTAIPFNVSYTDLDDSEVGSVELSNAPVGTTITYGDPIQTVVISSEDQKVVIDVEDAESLALTPPHDFSGTINVEMTTTIIDTEGLSADIKTISSDFQVNVTGDADTPILTVSGASGEEDSAIDLNIGAALRDTDGSESLSVTIEGIPDGALLSAGTQNIDGTWSLTSDQLENLTVTPSEDSNENFDLTITATSKENDTTGDTASTTLLLPVIVTGVADAATISASGSGIEDNHIVLDLNAVNEDSDSETLSYMISDVPSDVTLYRVDDEGNAITIDNDEYARIGEFGGFSDTGGTNWIISGDDLDNIRMIPQDDFSGTVSMNFAVTSIENDGDMNTVTVPLNVEVNPDLDTNLTDTSISGTEDNWMDLNLSNTGSDSEVITKVSIDSLPDGASALGVNVDGSYEILVSNNDGSYDISPEQISAGVAVLPDTNSDENFDLTITRTVTDTSDDGTNLTADTQTVTSTISVNVIGDSDSLDSITIDDDVTVEESNEIGVDSIISDIQHEDSDGSESRYFVIQNEDGADNTSWVVTGDGVINAGDGTFIVTNIDTANIQVIDTTSGDGSVNVTMTPFVVEREGDVLEDTANIQTTAINYTVGGEFTEPTVPTLDISQNEVSGAEDQNITDDLLNVNSNGDVSYRIEDTENGSISGNDLYSSDDGSHCNEDGLFLLPDGTFVTTDLDSIVVNPTEDFSGEVTLDVKVIASTDEGAESISSEELRINIDTATDGFNITTDAVGDEDTDIDLNIVLSQLDNDGSESIVGETVTVSVVSSSKDEEGNTQYDATTDKGEINYDGNEIFIDNGDGTYIVSKDALDDITFKGEDNIHGKVNLQIDFQAQDGEASIIDQSKIFTVNINSVVDDISLDVADNNLESTEGVSSINLGLTSTLSDDDGSEVGYIQIDGVPNGATLSHGFGQVNEDGSSSWLVPQSVAGIVALVPEEHFSSDTFTLDVVAKVYDLDSGTFTVSSSSEDINITVDPVASEVTVQASTAQGLEDSAINLNLNISMDDIDGSETLNIDLKDIPEGSIIELNATEYSPNENGVVTLTGVTLEDSQNITFTAPENTYGNFELGMDVKTVDTAGNVTSTLETAQSTTINVEVQATASDFESGSQIDVTVGEPQATIGGLEVPVSLTGIVLNDTDGSETLTISIEGLGHSANVTYEVGGNTLIATVDDDGTFSFELDPSATDYENVLESIKFTAEDANDLEGDISFTATATELSTGETHTLTNTITVDDFVSDAEIIETNNTGIDSVGDAIQLNLELPNSLDNNEKLGTITLNIQGDMKLTNENDEVISNSLKTGVNIVIVNSDGSINENIHPSDQSLDNMITMTEDEFNNLQVSSDTDIAGTVAVDTTYNAFEVDMSNNMIDGIDPVTTTHSEVIDVDETIVYDENTTIDAGVGSDTLEVEHDDIDLFELADSIKNVEVIDMDNGIDQTINADLDSIIDITDENHDLVFVGEKGDVLDFGDEEAWTRSDTKEKVDGQDGDFVAYESNTNTNVTVFVNDEIEVIQNDF